MLIFVQNQWPSLACVVNNLWSHWFEDANFFFPYEEPLRKWGWWALPGGGSCLLFVHLSYWIPSRLSLYFVTPHFLSFSFSFSFTLLTAGMIVLCLICLRCFTFCVFIAVRWYLLPEIQCGERSSIFLLMSFPSRLIFCVPVLFIHLHVIICIGIVENLYGNRVPDDIVKWFLHAVI